MAEYWPCSFFFCMCIDLDSVSVRKHNIVKKKLGQRPATLTSHLVNNLYTNCAVLENIHNPYKQLMYAPMVTDSKGAGLYQMLYKLEFSNAWDLKPWTVCGWGYGFFQNNTIFNPPPHLCPQISNIYILGIGCLVLTTSFALWFWKVYHWK